MPKSRIGKAFIYLFCLSTLVYGAVSLTQQVLFAAHAIRTTATVIGHEEDSECGKTGCTKYYPPTVTFTTDDGREITTTLTHARNRTAPPNGVTITIEYRSDDPSIAQRPQDATINWMMPSLMFGFGLICTVFYSFTLFGKPRKPASSLTPPVVPYYPPAGSGPHRSPAARPNDQQPSPVRPQPGWSGPGATWGHPQAPNSPTSGPQPPTQPPHHRS